MSHQHPANQQVYDAPLSLSERVGVRTAALMATGGFIVGQGVFILTWISLRKLGVPIDNTGLTILNLLLSLQAAFAAPLILLSQKRQSEHDRLRAEADHLVVQLLHRLIAVRCPACGTASPVGEDCPACSAA